MDNIFPYIGIFASAMGISWVSRDYLSSLLGGIILRKVNKIQAGTRVKVYSGNTVKGDIQKIGLFSTQLKEVGEGDRLPSRQTGRTILLPNSLIVNSPVLVYGSKIVDQVVAYVHKEPEKAIKLMKEAMNESRVKSKEVDLYQTGDKFAVHGIYESDAGRVSDTRNEIMKRYIHKEEIE
jgi:small-conductance mechanosensitive channel